MSIAHLAADRAPAAVLALVSSVLHAGGDQTVTAQEMALQTLVCEEPELTFLAVQGGPVVDHLRMDLDLRKEGKMGISFDSPVVTL